MAARTTATKAPADPAALDVAALIEAAVARALASVTPAPAATVAGESEALPFTEPARPWAVGDVVSHQSNIAGERPRNGVVAGLDAYGNAVVGWFESVSDPIHRGDPALTLTA